MAASVHASSGPAADGAAGQPSQLERALDLNFETYTDAIACRQKACNAAIKIDRVKQRTTYCCQSSGKALYVMLLGGQGMARLKYYEHTLAVIVALMMGIARAWQLLPASMHTAGSVVTTTVHLVAGASLLRYFLELCETTGIGDGVALTIVASVASGM